MKTTLPPLAEFKNSYRRSAKEPQTEDEVVLRAIRLRALEAVSTWRHCRVMLENRPQSESLLREAEKLGEHFDFANRRLIDFAEARSEDFDSRLSDAVYDLVESLQRSVSKREDEKYFERVQEDLAAVKRATDERERRIA